MRISIVQLSPTASGGSWPHKLTCPDCHPTYTGAIMSDLSVEAPPHPLIGQLSALHHFRIYVDIGVVVVVLALTNLIAHFTTPWANVATVPAAAVGLLLLVRSRGAGWSELGLGREHWKSGAGYALAAVALVGTVIAVGALLPWTRPMFMNDHYATVSGALVASMIIIPLQTVIPEELAFRGVLHGALDRAWGFRGVAAAGSLLFGMWHIATSLGLTSSNVGFTKLFGGGVGGMIAGVVLAVIATGAAGFVFTWLRRRSGSLIAPIALHWSLNGLGALAAALVWHLST
jgi:CAAX protease family protein